jgi:hypothetical protein
MQMENIFEKQIIHEYFFDQYLNLKDIKPNLLMYLYNNLDDENFDTFELDLEIALTINANGEYIY